MGVERKRKSERVHARMGERERESPLAPLFKCFFPSPGPVLCKLGLGRSAILPEVLTPVLGPSFDLLYSIFTGFSLPCLLAIAILNSFSLF